MSLGQLRGWGLRCCCIAGAWRKRVGSLRFVVLVGLLLVIAVVGSPRFLVAETLGFDITINFGDGLSDTYKAAFNEAATAWESIILGCKVNTTLHGVTITVSGYEGAVGGTIGSAGWSTLSTVGNDKYACYGRHYAVRHRRLGCDGLWTGLQRDRA